jgi:DNA primase
VPSGDAVREIKERLDIVEVIGSYVRLQRAGRDQRGLCPFHSEKTPSFHVSGEKQMWYCFGCSQGGDVFDFVEKAEGVDFKQTLDLLARRAGVVLEEHRGGRNRGKERASAREANKLAAQYYHHVLTGHRLGARGLKYLRERGVEDETIEAFQVGWSPGGRDADSLLRFLLKKGISADEAVKAGLALGGEGRRTIDYFRGRLLIPIRDDLGEVVAFGGRSMDGSPPKYLNSRQTAIYDKSRTIFGLSQAKKAIEKAGAAILVEGYFDVMMAHQNGTTNAVASSGTAVTSEQLKTLRRFAPDLLLCLDSDEAGQAATQRTIEMASKAGMRVRVIELPNAKDPGDFFLKTPQLWHEAEGAAIAGWEWWLRGVLADHDLETTDGRDRAAAAVVQLLNRIPEDTTMDIYSQLAAEQLRLDPARLVADVKRMRQTGVAPKVGVGRPVQVVAPAAPRAANGHLADDAVEDRLLSMLLVDERAWAALEEVGGLDAIETPAVRALAGRLADLNVGDGSGSLERHLDSFEPGERARLARLSLTATAAADEAELREAMADCINRIKLRGFKIAIEGLEDRLRETRQGGDDLAVTGLLTEIQALAREASSLRDRMYRGVL